MLVGAILGQTHARRLGPSAPIFGPLFKTDAPGRGHAGGALQVLHQTAWRLDGPFRNKASANSHVVGRLCAWEVGHFQGRTENREEPLAPRCVLTRRSGGKTWFRADDRLQPRRTCATFGHLSFRSDGGQSLPQSAASGQTRPTSDESASGLNRCLFSVEAGPHSFGRIWGNFGPAIGQIWPGIDEVCADCSRIWAVRANLGRL